MFQGLRNNALIYILDKTAERPKLRIGQIMQVTNPVPRYDTSRLGTFGQPPEQILDIKAKVGDEEITLKELPATGTITEKGGVIVTDSREAMASEVENLVRTSQLVLDSIEYHREVIAAGDTILRELNPQFAKEKEQEEKICSLEQQITSIGEDMGEIKRLLTKALDVTTPQTKK